MVPAAQGGVVEWSVYVSLTAAQLLALIIAVWQLRVISKKVADRRERDQKSVGEQPIHTASNDGSASRT
jgi:heme exporter protein D